MSTKYQFKKLRDPNNRHDISEVSIEVETIILPEIIQEFETFLRACGFCFKGNLEIVNDEKD